MKNTKPRFYRSRRFLTTLLVMLIAIGFIILFFSRVLITLPFKDSFVQININHGVNAFFPRDKNSLFYFRNSLKPQVITGANTSYKGMEGLPYFQIDLPFKLPSIPQYSLPNPLVNLPTPEISNITEKAPGPSSIPKPDAITSKKANLTFKIPPDYYLEYKPATPATNMEVININNGPTGLKDNWMSIQLYEAPNCTVDSSNIGYYTPTKEVVVAGKWPMLITKDHPRYGSREHQGKICLDNGLTLNMDRYVKEDGNQAESDFDKILETAIYRPN